MTDITGHKIKSGDRLRLNDLERQRNPRQRARFCTVIQVGSKRNGAECIIVRFDGNVGTTRVHRSYLEPLTSSETADRFPRR